MILEIRGELDTHARVRAGEGVLTFNFANLVARVLNEAQVKSIDLVKTSYLPT